MKALLLLLISCFVLSGCTKQIFFAIYNENREPVTFILYRSYPQVHSPLYSYINDTLSIKQNDSTYFWFVGSSLSSYKTIKELGLQRIDSIKIRTESRTVLYHDKIFIDSLLFNNKDTANILVTKVKIP